MQKSWQIVKKTGDKGKQIRRFDKFVITRRLALLTGRPEDTNQNWEQSITFLTYGILVNMCIDKMHVISTTLTSVWDVLVT